MEALTKLSDEKELERYLSYGKWGLSDDDIVRLNKDEEMKQRVSFFYILFMTSIHQFPDSPIHDFFYQNINLFIVFWGLTSSNLF